MPTGEGGRSRTARHELLKMVPNVDSAVALVRACFELPCTLRGNAPPRRSVDTCAAGANTTDLLPDVVVPAGEALRSGTAVGEVVSPSWPRVCTAGAADVSVVMTADIATAAAAMGAVVAAVEAAVPAMGAVDVAAQGVSVADGHAAGCDLDHRRGAWLSLCRGGLAHRLHLQPRFGRHPHGQRLALGLRPSSSVDPTEALRPGNPIFQFFQIKFTFHCIQTNLIEESESQAAQYCTFISRAGVVTWYLASFIKMTCTRAKYSATGSLAPISSDSNSLFALSYAASCVSAVILASGRHTSKRDPILITISMISLYFSKAFVNACHAFREFSTRLYSCSLSSSARGVSVVFTTLPESSAKSE